MPGLSSWIRVGTALALALVPDSASAGLANVAGCAHALRLAGGGPDLPGLRTQRNQPAQGWDAPASTANAHAFTASWEELLRAPNGLGGATSPDGRADGRAAGFGVGEVGGAQDPFVDMGGEGAARSGGSMEEEEDSEQEQAVEDDAMGYNIQDRIALEDNLADAGEDTPGAGGRASGWTQERGARASGGGGGVRAAAAGGGLAGAGECAAPASHGESLGKRVGESREGNANKKQRGAPR